MEPFARRSVREHFAKFDSKAYIANIEAIEKGGSR